MYTIYTTDTTCVNYGGEKMKSNHELRSILSQNGLYIWQLAEAVGIHETTMTKWLRTPLNAEQQQRVDEALTQLTVDELTVK